MATSYLGALGAYDESETWTNYSERFEQFCVTNEIDDPKRKVAVFLSTIGAEAYALVKNLAAPAAPTTKTLEELCKLMKDYYEPAPLIIAERFKFHKRDQEEEEGTQQYFAELKKLSATCNFGTFIDEAIRDRFVCGLSDVRIQKRLLSETSLSSKKALTLAVTWEQASLEETTKLHKLKLNARRSKGSGRDRKSEVGNCHRCGNRHSATECRFIDAICFSCRSTGHLSRMCQLKKKKGEDKNLRPGKKFFPPKNAAVNELKEESESDEEESEELNFLGSVNTISTSKPISLDLKLNEEVVSMEPVA